MHLKCILILKQQQKKNHQEIGNNQTLSHGVKNQNYYEIGLFDK